MKKPDLHSVDVRWPALFFFLALAISVVGFWPSFFSILTQVTRTDLLHGWSATSWLTLTVVQACLIGSGRPGLHRRLGYFSVALALLVVITGFGAVQNQTLRNLEEVKLYRYMFNVSNLTQLVAFTAFLFLGIVAARRGAIAHHLRFMMGTSLIVLPPAFERLWANLAPALVTDYGVALYLSILTVEVILAALVFADWRRGKIYPQFPSIFVLFAVIMAFARPIAEAPWFQAFSQWFAGI
jgi:hypothetical protein